MPKQIKIAVRNQPYTLAFGEICLLPNSSYALQTFPAKLRILRIADLNEIVAEIEPEIQGPVQEFTTMVDLEKSSIRIWGRAANGFYRYCIKSLSENEGVIFSLEKCPEGKLKLNCSSKNWKISDGMHFELSAKGSFIFGRGDAEIGRSHPTRESLSLGCHKAQDWSMIRRRNNLQEIIPLWYASAQCLHGFQAGVPEAARNRGNFALLENCRSAMENSKNDQLYSAFLNAFQAGFQGFLIPQIQDRQYQGYSLPPFPEGMECSPLAFLNEGAQLIRSLFISHDERELHLLPNLPPEFHCGRFLNICCNSWGTLDMEWSKKKMRRGILSIQKSGSISIRFPSALKQCRLSRGKENRGEAFFNGSSLQVSAGEVLYLDRFTQ